MKEGQRGSEELVTDLGTSLTPLPTFLFAWLPPSLSPPGPMSDLGH